MWAQLSAFFAALRALADLLKFLRQWQKEQAQQKQAEREERQQKMEKAVDQSKEAQSEEDIWKSQDDIVSNGPRY